VLYALGGSCILSLTDSSFSVASVVGPVSVPVAGP